MDSLQLKDGRTVRIEAWDNDRLAEYVAAGHPTTDLGDISVFDGFTFFGPHVVEERRKATRVLRHDYAATKHLSLLERQAERRLPDDAYDRSIVALDGERVVGINRAVWWRGWFWHYSHQYIDVQKGFKNKGVGTGLLRALDEAEFLQGRILALSHFEPEGERYLTRPVARELKAQRYALLPYGHMNVAPPGKPGIYDICGNPASSIIDEQ